MIKEIKAYGPHCNYNGLSSSWAGLIVPSCWQDYVIKLSVYSLPYRGRDFFCTRWIFSHLSLELRF